MSTTAKDTIPMLIASIIGILIIVEYFAPPILILTDVKGSFTSWSVIIGAFTMLLGVVYLIRFHALRISKLGLTQEGPYSTITLATLFLFIVVGFGFGGTGSAEYTLIFMNIMKPIASITRGICFFYCISAAYRGFKLSSWDASSLFIAGILYTLRQIPIGPATWAPIAPIGDWILNYPNVAAARGAIVATALGSIVIALRTLYGKEMSIKMVSETG